MGITWTERRPPDNIELEWRFASSSADGTHILAGCYYYHFWLSADGGTTWTRPVPNPAIEGIYNEFFPYWNCGAVSADGTHVVVAENLPAVAGLGRVYLSHDFGATWAEIRPAGDVDMDWETVAISSDGSVIVVGSESDGALYISTDGGATWTARNPGASSGWYATAISPDGTKIVAAGDRLYTSTDTGATWVERQPAGALNKYWRSVACDSTCTTILAAVYSGRVYRSTNGGGTWAEVQPDGAANRSWYRVAVSGDGNIALAGHGTKVFLSTNGGAAWAQQTPLGVSSKRWECLTLDDDGSYRIVGGAVGRLAVSISGGVWTEWRPGGTDLDREWASVSCDTTGAIAIACCSSGRLYTSTDYGVTWTERQPAGNVNKDWYDVAVSADGRTFVAGANRLYTSADGGVTWMERRPRGDVNYSWDAVAVDDDGSFLIVASKSGKLYTSADGGATWTLRTVSGGITAACDRDGTNLIVGQWSGHCYVSNDGGATWTDKDVDLVGTDALHIWHDTAISRDGQTMLVVGYGAVGMSDVFVSYDAGATWGYLSTEAIAGDAMRVAVDSDASTILLGTGDNARQMQVSFDGGATWQLTAPSDLADFGLWWSLAVNGDGTRFFAGDFPLRLYTGAFVAPAYHGQVIMVDEL